MFTDQSQSPEQLRQLLDAGVLNWLPTHDRLNLRWVCRRTTDHMTLDRCVGEDHYDAALMRQALGAKTVVFDAPPSLRGCALTFNTRAEAENASNKLAMQYGIFASFGGYKMVRDLALCGYTVYLEEQERDTSRLVAQLRVNRPFIPIPIVSVKNLKNRWVVLTCHTTEEAAQLTHFLNVRLGINNCRGMGLFFANIQYNQAWVVLNPAQRMQVVSLARIHRKAFKAIMYLFPGIKIRNIQILPKQGENFVTCPDYTTACNLRDQLAATCGVLEASGQPKYVAQHLGEGNGWGIILTAANVTEQIMPRAEEQSASRSAQAQ